LVEEADKIQKQVNYKRMPIMDLSVPSQDVMAEILDSIDFTFYSGDNIYFHCPGGTGRTG
jgi:protein-tyrosine phosphatase